MHLKFVEALENYFLQNYRLTDYALEVRIKRHTVVTLISKGRLTDGFTISKDGLHLMQIGLDKLAKFHIEAIVEKLEEEEEKKAGK